MLLNPAKRIFPGWSANVALVGRHGADAARWAKEAVTSERDLGTRLDKSVRAMTSFDHAVDNLGALPARWLVPHSGKFITGYHIAKQAVTLLVASGLIPAAQARVGRESLQAAFDYFREGVDAAKTDRTRYSAKLGSGWLTASVEDAMSGTLMLRPGSDLSRELLGGIEQIRKQAQKRQTIDETLTAKVSALFEQAGAELSEEISQAERDFVAPTDSHSEVIAKSDELLKEVQSAATGISSAAQIPAELQ